MHAELTRIAEKYKDASMGTLRLNVARIGLATWTMLPDEIAEFTEV